MRIGDIRTSVAYSNGHLVYLQDDARTLVARPFDLDRGTFTGEPFPVSDRVEGVRFSASANGALATSCVSFAKKLVWVGRDGGQLGMLGEPGGFSEPRISPDGSRIAVATGSPVRGNTTL